MHVKYKHISQRQIESEHLNLANLEYTGITSLIDGVHFAINNDCTWSCQLAVPIFKLESKPPQTLVLESTAGQVILEDAIISKFHTEETRDSASTTLSGIARSVIIRNPAVPFPNDNIVYRTYVDAWAKLPRRLTFPEAIKDLDSKGESATYLPLHIADMPLDVYFVPSLSLFIIEASHKSLIPEAFSRISWACRVFLTYLFGVRLDTNWCDVMSVKDTNAVLLRKYFRGRVSKGSISDIEFLPVIDTATLPPEQAHRRNWSSPLCGYDPYTISRCFTTYLTNLDLSTTLEYVIRAIAEPLEMRGVFLSIAIETLTDWFHIKHKQKFNRPLKDNQWELLRPALEDVLMHQPNDLDDKAKNTILNRINELNSATNSAKLLQPFEIMGIKLTEEEKKAIKNRNKFIHKGRLSQSSMFSGNADYWLRTYQVEMLLYTAINKLILSILDYHGQLVDWGRMPVGFHSRYKQDWIQ